MSIVSKIFKFKENAITVLQSGENVYFHAFPVANMLGYKKPSNAVKQHVREKHRLKVRDLKNPDLGLSVKGLKEATVLISEPGLYSLIMHSKLESAEEFQDYVYETILPSIRKTGKYELEQEPIRKRLTFKIENEYDLHTKLVNFIQNYYPNALIVATLGENQDTVDKRIKSKKCGYAKGSPDLIINNLHKKFRGFAIELKTPKGNGTVSKEQIKMLKRYEDNGFKTLVSNDYDECVKNVIEYFQDVRIACKYCSRRFKYENSLLCHHKGFHKIE
jgi:prophage antirepressor-like protein